MSKVRKLIPCIYLYDEKAVKGVTDKTVLYDDPLELVQIYNERGVNSIFLYETYILWNIKNNHIN